MNVKQDEWTDTEKNWAMVYGLCWACGAPRRPYHYEWLDDQGEKVTQMGVTCSARCENPS